MNKERTAKEINQIEIGNTKCMKFSENDEKEFLNLNKMNSDKRIGGYLPRELDSLGLARPVIVMVDPFTFGQMNINDLRSYTNPNC